MYLSSLKSDLQTLHKRLPSNFEDTRPLGMAFYATSLGLYQLSLSMFNRRREQNINPSEIQYDEMACAAINSAEALLDLYLSLPAGLEVGFTNSMWIQTAFAMLIAYRHTAAMATSTQAVALLRTLSQLRERLEGLSTSAVDMNGDRDTFVDFRSRVSRIEERLISHTAMQEQTSEHTPHPDETFVGGMGGTPVAEDFGGTMSYDGMLLNPEVGCGMANDFLFTASLDQIMSSWL
ncbi:hypothetical protein N7468_002436 [Penicillium chermesinum]|uniref:Uncharacterized protein n=1 Tax=Penicillium chermesinum TaxID=63820 RepID=A0A9W9PKM9_9EURO|nr:uncharacterized protein N7468_002436 [Penicillium chermesinum]KAJ5247453.1 hypothetical protein N7468_002436 [Penicillium chermesinum]KAJ6145691.1 hypothetical protein N7470_009586 [Penicillium chermesinum]